MKEKWLVSVMIGFGRSAQYLMTDRMGFEEAQEMLEDIVRDLERGRWVEVGNTYVNPAQVTTVRVVKERDGPGGYYD